MKNGSKWRGKAWGNWARVREMGRQVQGLSPQCWASFAPLRGPGEAPERLARRFLRPNGSKRLYWCISYVICATRIPSYTKPPKPQPIRTGLPPPRWLAIRAASKVRRRQKNQPRGLPVTLSAPNTENQGVYGRGIGSGACAARYRHPPIFAPYAQHHWGPFDTPGGCFRPRETTQQSRSAAQ
jgi:hypothetical protein